MYTCVGSFLQGVAVGSRLQSAAVNSSKIRDLMTNNRKVILILTHPSVVNPMSLDLNDVTQKIYSTNPDFTVSQWLTSLGGAALPTNTKVPTIKTGSIAFNEVFQAGYTVNRVPSTAADDAQLPESELRDIRLKKADVPYTDGPAYLLGTVNGLLHMVDGNSQGLKIKEGGISTYIANQHHIGLISFKKVGKITCLPITSARIAATDGTNLYNGVTLKVPEIDLTNKVVMLSLGGFLHFGNDLYRTVGAGSIQLRWSSYPLARRYDRSRKLIDMSAFESSMIKNDDHPTALDLEQAKKNETIKAYLQLAQSFIIVVDVDNLFYGKYGVEKTGLPGKYYCYNDPVFPLQLSSGLLPAYLAVKETNKFVLSVQDYFDRRYAHETRPPAIDQYTNDARISQDPEYYSSGYFLEIGTESLSYETA